MTEAEYRLLLDGWREGNLLREAAGSRGQVETSVASLGATLQSPPAPPRTAAAATPQVLSLYNRLSCQT
jgi:hypothetical protein